MRAQGLARGAAPTQIRLPAASPFDSAAPRLLRAPAAPRLGEALGHSGARRGRPLPSPPRGLRDPRETREAPGGREGAPEWLGRGVGALGGWLREVRRRARESLSTVEAAREESARRLAGVKASAEAKAESVLARAEKKLVGRAPTPEPLPPGPFGDYRPSLGVATGTRRREFVSEAAAAAAGYPPGCVVLRPGYSDPRAPYTAPRLDDETRGLTDTRHEAEVSARPPSAGALGRAERESEEALWPEDVGGWTFGPTLGAARVRYELDFGSLLKAIRLERCLRIILLPPGGARDATEPTPVAPSEAVIEFRDGSVARAVVPPHDFRTRYAAEAHGVEVWVAPAPPATDRELLLSTPTFSADTVEMIRSTSKWLFPTVVFVSMLVAINLQRWYLGGHEDRKALREASSREKRGLDPRTGKPIVDAGDPAGQAGVEHLSDLVVRWVTESGGATSDEELLERAAKETRAVSLSRSRAGGPGGGGGGGGEGVGRASAAAPDAAALLEAEVLAAAGVARRALAGEFDESRWGIGEGAAAVADELEALKTLEHLELIHKGPLEESGEEAETGARDVPAPSTAARRGVAAAGGFLPASAEELALEAEAHAVLAEQRAVAHARASAKREGIRRAREAAASIGSFAYEEMRRGLHMATARIWPGGDPTLLRARRDALRAVAKLRGRFAADPHVFFDDVAGAGAAKRELRELVDFLLSPDMYEESGARAPKGILLAGPPGTGKTLLARAVAGEAGVTFISVNASEFCEMFVGLGAQRVRELFATARRCSPAIVFIDEFDAVGKARGGAVGNDERDQTVNQLLVELDGFKTESAVLVVAATNRPDVLDVALRRSGRFDRVVTVGLPTPSDRKRLLELALNRTHAGPDVDVAEIADRTVGGSGAGLVGLVNSAAVIAAREGCGEVAQRHLRAAIDASKPPRNEARYSDDGTRHLALLEAGFCVAAALLPTLGRIEEASVVPRGGSSLGASSLVADPDRFDSGVVTRRFARETMVALLAPRAAEEVFLGPDALTVANATRLAEARALAARMVLADGFSQHRAAPLNSRVLAVSPDIGRPGARVVPSSIPSDAVEAAEDAIEAELAEGYQLALDLVRRNREAVTALRDALFEHQEMEGGDIERIVDRAACAADLEARDRARATGELL